MKIARQQRERKPTQQATAWTCLQSYQRLALIFPNAYKGGDDAQRTVIVARKGEKGKGMLNTESSGSVGDWRHRRQQSLRIAGSDDKVHERSRDNTGREPGPISSVKLSLPCKMIGLALALQSVVFAGYT